MKDNFYVEGVDTTVGFVGWSNDPAAKEQESAMTLVMRESGAILFCKTCVIPLSQDHPLTITQECADCYDDAGELQQRECPPADHSSRP